MRSTRWPRSQFLALTGALALSLTAAACGEDPTDGESASPVASPESTPQTGQSTGAGDDAATADDATATDDALSTTTGTDGFPVTLDTPVGEVWIEEKPDRIVSLSPSATEILFAIGAGDQVVAVDEWSNYPPEAPTTDLSGYEPNIEAILGYEPDLVVIADDTGDLAASLESADVPVLLNPAPTTIEQGWDGMAALGLATGSVEETAQTIADLRREVDEAFAQASQVRGEGIRVYHELDDTGFAASSASFIGDIYAQMGAVNIADPADSARSGYPQLTEEAVIAADPQLIVITDQVGYTAEDVAARPGWEQVSAVQDGNIVTVDTAIASRWGPRLPQLITTLAEAMTQAAAAPASR